MCGIVGCFGEYSIEEIKTSTEKIKHRGPDDTAFLLTDLFGCGFVRLSIIDIDGGAQPIKNEDCTIYIVCNGEIYNYVDLRSNLISNGHVFRTKSDAEVILHLYEEYGEDCINYLQGMYAFAVYDDRKKELLLGRDHIGIKPMFYEVMDNCVFFGSELKLFSRDAGRDMSSIKEQNVFGFIADTSATIYKNVKQVAPGEILTFKYPLLNRIEKVKANYILDSMSVEDALFKAIETHLLNSDIDVGLALSGGLDSSLVVAMCSEVKKDLVVFTAYNNYDEDLVYARLIADRYNLEHVELKLSEDGMHEDIEDVLDYSIDVNKSSTFDTVGDVAVYLFYKKVSKYVKVLLSGDGGDELFGGYWMHKKPLGYKDMLIEKGGSVFTQYLENMFPESNESLCRKTVLDLLLNSAMPNYHLLTLDRCSMRNGVEARVPYLDINVIGSVINSFSDDERQGKVILNRLYKKYLPKSIIERKKIGFPYALK